VARLDLGQNLMAAVRRPPSRKSHSHWKKATMIQMMPIMLAVRATVRTTGRPRA